MRLCWPRLAGVAVACAAVGPSFEKQHGNRHARRRLDRMCDACATPGCIAHDIFVSVLDCWRTHGATCTGVHPSVQSHCSTLVAPVLVVLCPSPHERQAVAAQWGWNSPCAHAAHAGRSGPSV